MELPFADRREAGRVLGARLAERYADRDDVLVLALPRGGVPVGYEVAGALGAPLDLLLVRKLGLPGHEELAMGAIATGGAMVLNDEVVGPLRIDREVIDRVAAREREEMRRRQEAYRGNRPEPAVRGRRVIVVDDGLATGSTMLAAVKALRQQDPAEIVVAVPVAPPETCEALDREPEIDRVVCAATPAMFGGVGRWYVDFEQTGDEEVRDLLERSRRDQHASVGEGPGPG